MYKTQLQIVRGSSEWWYMIKSGIVIPIKHGGGYPRPEVLTRWYHVMPCTFDINFAIFFEFHISFTHYLIHNYKWLINQVNGNIASNSNSSCCWLIFYISTHPSVLFLEILAKCLKKGSYFWLLWLLVKLNKAHTLSIGWLSFPELSMMF